MAGNQCELELRTQIALWQSSRPIQRLIEFVVRGGHIQMRMNGLEWSIEALPLLIYHSNSSFCLWGSRRTSDAQIMAVACDTAREAIQQAVEAAAAFFAELMACFSQQNIITEEVWATSFYATEIWNLIAQAAVDGGNVHHDELKKLSQSYCCQPEEGVNRGSCNSFYML
ncbi:hypothetical protein SUGI_0976260 [Cryptomeria japonica]|nr:hypothetical protein SUGI_0976260 [Cryptomeria japonica]